MNMQPSAQNGAFASSPLAARFLERALLFTLVMHALAMVSMALLLLPGMPGGGQALAARVSYIAANPTLWRIGWLPWQLTALSDLILAVALLRTAWIPRLPAVLILILTLIAIAFEQPNEFAWITQGVALAQAGNLAVYAQFEAHTFPLVGAWAALFYALAACLWSWCFFRAKTWHPGLTWLSVITWGVLIAVSMGPLLPADLQPSAALIAAGNALGFVLMLIWFAWVTELVLRRARPDEPHGRLAIWRHPRRDLIGRLFNLIANSRLIRAYGELLPLPAFISDIRDVIYINYVVEAERLAPLVPWGLELQRLGTDGRYTLFTHLTYQHGHFGPRMLGSLRRLLPSSVQSNWRIYVRDPQTDHSGIFFVSTAMNQTLPALLARMLSEGVPMHVVQQGEVTAQPDGSFAVCLDPGAGSAPDLAATLRPCPIPQFSGIWRDCFPSYRDFLAYCVPQDRALSSQRWYRRVTRQEIELGIPLDSCEPLIATSLESHAAQALVGDAETVCFHVARVTLRVLAEIHDYRP